LLYYLFTHEIYTSSRTTGQIGGDLMTSSQGLAQWQLPLEASDLGSVRSWKRQILEASDLGNVRSWKRQILETSDLGNVRSWKRQMGCLEGGRLQHLEVV